MVTGGPTKPTFIFGFASFIMFAMLTSTWNPGEEVNSTSSSKSLAMRDASASIETPCGGRVENFAVFEHAGGIAQPHRIPVRLDLARGGPARARAAVETFKRRRIQK